MNDAPVTVTYDAAPQAKGRPRFGKGRAYTPLQARKFQQDFGWCAKASMEGRRPLTGAVTVVARFDLPIPPSWSQRKRADAISGTIRPTTTAPLPTTAYRRDRRRPQSGCSSCGRSCRSTLQCCRRVRGCTANITSGEPCR